MSFRATFFSVLFLLSAPGLAYAETMVCQIKKERSTGGYIPLNPTVVFDPDAGTAKASYKQFGKVVSFDGHVNASDPGRFSFVFTGHDIYSNTRQYVARMVYRATYFKKNGRVKVTAKPLGYANIFRGQGKCLLK